MPDHVVYVAIGSNIDPERNIPAGLERLAEALKGGKGTRGQRGKGELEAVSPFYRSVAVGRPGQPAFWNGVVRLRTDLDARSLKFDVLRPVEAASGRVRTADAYAPRTLDLDILLFDTAIIREPGLCVPDPEIPKRPFLAQPLLDLAPDLVLPDSREPLRNAPCLQRPAGLVLMEAFSRAVKERLGI